MAIGKLQIRALPQQPLVAGYPSIPADPLVNRPAPEINGIVQLTSSNTELLAAYLTIELLQIQALPAPANSPFSATTTAKTVTTIWGVPTTLWAAQDTESTPELAKTNCQSLIVPCDFQFNIKLPLHLPPSITIDPKTGHGISYQLKATLCAKPIKSESNHWFKRSSHPTLPTTISTTLDLEINRYDTLPAWPIYQNTSESNHSTNHHAVSMKITNNRLAIGPGDQISSQIVIESSNIHPIKLVRFELNLLEQIIYRHQPTVNKTHSLDLSHQSEEIKLSNISNAHAKVNHHVFQKDRLSFNMHLGLPINHQKLTVSGASLLSISYYMSVKAYFESPRKHFLKTNKQIPTQLLIEKIPLIVGDRDFARAQLAVDKIGPVPHLFNPPNNTFSSRTVNQTPYIPPAQQKSRSHRAHDWKQAQKTSNQNLSRVPQLPPRASLQLLPKSTTDFPSSQRSHHSPNPSHPTRHHTFSTGPLVPLANHSPHQQYAQGGPSRLSFHEVSQSHFPLVNHRSSSPSHHLDSSFPGSSLQLVETPTRHRSSEAPNVQLTRSLSVPPAQLVEHDDAGNEKARLFARAKAEAAMNQARLQKATFFSSLDGHPMAIAPGPGDPIASSFSSSSAAAAYPTAHQEKQILQTSMMQDNHDHHGPLANLGFQDERFSEVATISSLPQYSNNPDPSLQSDHARPFSSSLISGSSSHETPRQSLSQPSSSQPRSPSPPPPPVNLSTRPSPASGKARASRVQGPRTSRHMQSGALAPPMTVIDPQREAYLKAVVERERYFYSHVHSHSCPSTDLRAYEAESNLPDKVLSALEEKDRLRSLWQSPPQPTCTSQVYVQPSEPPAQCAQESVSSDGHPVSTTHRQEEEEETASDLHADDCGETSCMTGLLAELSPVDLSLDLDFSELA